MSKEKKVTEEAKKEVVLDQNGNDVEHINKVSLFHKFNNRFLLAVGVAKRAKQLKDGVKPMIEITDWEKPRFVETGIREFREEAVATLIRDDEQDNIEMLEEMDHLLDTEMKEDAEKEENKVKEKSKLKKSLAA